MRSEWHEYTGFGELLCLVLAWVIGIAAVWGDFASRTSNPGASNVAATSSDRPSASQLD